MEEGADRGRRASQSSCLQQPHLRPLQGGERVSFVSGVAFEDVNVLADGDARDELVKLTGQMSIPVIVVGDQVVRGFNKAALKSLLGL